MNDNEPGFGAGFIFGAVLAALITSIIMYNWHHGILKEIYNKEVVIVRIQKHPDDEAEYKVEATKSPSGANDECQLQYQYNPPPIPKTQP
jgi:hypothetical protein